MWELVFKSCGKGRVNKGSENERLSLTLGLCEVQNLRQPTNFEFGRGTNFAWQNSEAVVPNRISPVSFFSHT